MTVQASLRTIDLAQAGGISVQQVRNYEAGGFIPPAERSPAGYRLYTRQHLVALQTARSMVSGYNWQRTRAIMQAVHQDNLMSALALIDERHAELASKRLQVERTLTALSTLADTIPQEKTYQTQGLRIGEAAREVGVRVSAVHFWEQQGLVHPLRDKSSNYRLYDEQQMRRLRVVALLREASYNFDVIQSVLDELAADRPQKAIAAVEKRRQELAKTSWSCLESMSKFQRYVSEFYMQPL